MRYFSSIIFFFLSYTIYAQHRMEVDATLFPKENSIAVKQKIIYHNTSESTLTYIYLYDWLNAFSDKNSALGKSFSEEFVRKFHFANKKERGGTTINQLRHDSLDLIWKRPLGFADVIQLKPNKPILPGERYTIDIDYLIQIPNAKFTSYGVDNNGIKLKYWLLKPAFYDKQWFIYPNKRLFDMPQQLVNLQLNFVIPKNFQLISSLVNETIEKDDQHKYFFPAQQIVDTDIYITKQSTFEITHTAYTSIYTNIEDDGLIPEVKSIIALRVIEFLTEKLGDYPFDKVLLSKEDYQLSPVYGLNQLPAFIRPFPDGFQYDIKLMKALSSKFLKNTIFINTRKDKWILDAIQINLMLEYIDTYYKEMKLLGKLSDFIILKWFHAAELDFNDQYDFLYKNVTRNNIHQSLQTPLDSLIRFNQKIGNPYHAGLGLNFLKHYTSPNHIQEAIKNFYTHQQLKKTQVKDFKNFMEKSVEKDISWFFEHYTNLLSPIDFSILSVKKQKDSMIVTIRNLNKTKVPVSLFWLKDKKPIKKIWISPFDSITSIKLPKKQADRIALNHDAVIPEVNNRNNYKGITKLFNKPLQLRLLEDIEDSRYSQLFVLPEFKYNIYDGIALGPKLYNTTLLPRKFSYKVTPKYALNSRAFVGSGSIDYTAWRYNKDLFAVKFGANGSRFSYDFDLFFERYSAFLSLLYRDNSNRRNNQRQALSLRTVNVRRDRDSNNLVNDPDYNVFNIRYNFQNKNLDKFFTASIDYEIAQKFSKVFANARFRRLYENNRQINLRLFLGTFIYNDTGGDTDFFSFALDRPSDYMFDLNYYGRSEESGLFSQQFIMAEGGFKSQLEPDFANQWITAFNTSTTIWNWIFAYADAGFVGNKFESPQFVYDSGIRLNLVEDYFEVYFPIYSSKGWEFNTPNYEESIRFIVSIDFGTLFKLFTRKWY